MNQHKTQVAWSEVTCTKSKGGLGIEKLFKWSKAAALKHIWHIITDEANNMWIDWVSKKLLKEQSFWYANPLAKCSWVWKKILSLRYLI